MYMYVKVQTLQTFKMNLCFTTLASDKNLQKGENSLNSLKRLKQRRNSTAP